MSTKDAVVNIVSINTGEIVHSVPCEKSRAEKVERGLLRNMNMDAFYTEIKEAKE